MLKRVLDPIIELDEQKFSTMKSLDFPLLVLARPFGDDMSFGIMSSLAQQELSDSFFVGTMNELPFGDTSGNTAPAVAVFNVLDETIPTYQGSFERPALLEFVSKVSSPLIKQIDLSNLGSFMKVN